MNFYSDARQDQFVANLLEFKRDGFYIDIGASHPIGANNSFFFESLGWKGICVECKMEPWIFMFKQRTCNFINTDALILDYEKILSNMNAPRDIDYLSVDIDQLSYDALIRMPFDKYRFKTITIEHDAYIHGDLYKNKQKEFLTKLGYEIICENVFVQQQGHDKPNCPFEDWWIYPEFFDKTRTDKIKCINQYPSDIIAKFQTI